MKMNAIMAMTTTAQATAMPIIAPEERVLWCLATPAGEVIEKVIATWSSENNVPFRPIRLPAGARWMQPASRATRTVTVINQYCSEFR
jgi:hypothetical protein